MQAMRFIRYLKASENYAYANLFILEPESEGDIRNPSHPAHEIAEMWTRGSAVAARLGIYLVAVMEAYANDIV